MFKKIASYLATFSTLRVRILFNLLLFACIPFLIISISVYVFMYKNISSKYTTELYEKSNSCVQMLNREITNYINKSVFIINDTDFITSIRNVDFDSNPETLISAHKNLSKLVHDFELNELNVEQFTFFLVNCKGPAGRYFKPLDSEGMPFIRDALSKLPPNTILWDRETGITANNYSYLTFYRGIVVGNKNYGIMQVNIPLKIIEFCFNSVNYPNNAVITYQNKYGNTIYSKGGQTAVNELSTKENEYLFAQNSIDMIDKGMITAVISKKVIYKEYALVLLLTAFITVILLIGLITVSRATSGRITKRLNSFINSIKENDIMQLKEKFQEIDTNDEISEIKKKFVNILSKMDETYRDLNNARSQNSMLHLELLQSRLNPHLLYNSLAVINWYAIRQNDKKTVEIVDALTKYYRIALNEGSHITRVSDELNLIREYIRIVNLTDSYYINLIINVDQELMDRHILLLLLQSVVENAVIHGLYRINNGALTINGYIRDADLLFEVIDNGHGMKAETVNSLLDSSYISSRRGYGIKNLIKRIGFYYGQGYGIKIKSQEGKGTMVTIKVKLTDQAEGGKYDEKL